MARTKASVGAKVSSGKSSKARCSAAPPPSTPGPSGSSERPSRSYSGGNSVCPRETPKWQRPITNFFIGKSSSRDSDSDTDDGSSASTSKPKHKRNIIESDDENTPKEPERPKNKVLDETIELEPLTGEYSHKIEEYYTKNGVTGKENGVTGEQNGVNGEHSGVNDEEKFKGKGKGKGKKTNKENVDSNIEKRKSVKRDLEEIAFGEESVHVSKRVKVN